MRRLFGLIVLLSFFLLLPVYALADTVYTVKKGDNLYKISKKFGISIHEIKTKNNISSSRIKPGIKLHIPTKDKNQDINPQHPSRVTCNPPNLTSADKTRVNQAKDETRSYTVKKGDTLLKISKKFSLSLNDLKEINNLTSTKLKPGQKLLVKRIRPKTYTVRKGDNIYKIARKFDIDVDELKNINSLETDILKPGQKILLEPEEKQEITNDGTILSEVQIEKEIKEISASEKLSQISLQDKLILFAKKLINIPYRFGGNSLFGIDCSGFVQKVYGMIGVNLPRSAREQFQEGELIDKDALSIGDLVFFRTYAPFPSHVGIYLGDDLFIHASSSKKRVTIDSLTEPYYIKRFIGAKRVIGEEVTDGG
jgi:peptidoglycan endopeptidase LytE